jgi:hypothetical protein
MWSHDVVSTSINLAGDLKMGQYLKIPPRVMFLSQVWGTILGMSLNIHRGRHLLKGIFLKVLLLIMVDSQFRSALIDDQSSFDSCHDLHC